MSASDPYDVILERLDYVGSARLRRVLEAMMTADQARMVVALPGTPQDVAESTGIELPRVKDALDELFFKGVVFPRGDFRRREYYRLARSVGQLHDAVLATVELDVEKDQPFFELWWDFKMNEMYPRSAEHSKGQDRPSSRLIPAYKSIKDLDGVLPCENYPEIIKAQERIAVVPCSCRLNAASMGEPCDVHDEVAEWSCIQFGRAADYIITRGSGKELTIEETLKLSDTVEEAGLLHSWPNSTLMAGPRVRDACQCCRDCCILTVPKDQAGLSLSSTWEKSRYQAYVIPDDCDGCQVCVDRCLFDAIEMQRSEGSKKYKAVIDPEKCFGCGVCVVGCEPAALKMKAVRPPEHIPEAV